MERSPAVNRRPVDWRARLWWLAEAVAWGIGLVCVVAWSAISVDGVIGRRAEIARFAALQAASLRQPDPPDQSLWSRERIAAWRDALKEPGPAPLAILRIPRIHLEVPVLEGTDDVVLNRGAGHIDDTAKPGSDGNS